MQEIRTMMEVMTSRAQRVAKPKKRCEPKKIEPPAAAPKRGRRDSAGDQGTQIAKRPKSKVASKKN